MTANFGPNPVRPPDPRDEGHQMLQDSNNREPQSNVISDDVTSDDVASNVSHSKQFIKFDWFRAAIAASTKGPRTLSHLPWRVLTVAWNFSDGKGKGIEAYIETFAVEARTSKRMASECLALLCDLEYLVQKQSGGGVKGRKSSVKNKYELNAALLDLQNERT